MQNSRLKHTIIVGNETEIDNCTYLTEIANKANSASIINVYNSKNTDAKTFYGSAIKENTDVVFVYTNNIQVDYIEFIQFALKNICVMKRNIKFVFLARTSPFKLNTYITSHFNILTASRSLNPTVKPNANRLKTKILNIQNTIQAVQDSETYNPDEKNLFNNYFKKQLVDRQTELYNQ